MACESSCPVVPFANPDAPIRGTRSGGGASTDNCQNGGILTKSVTLDVLAAADGASFVTAATAAVAGDHLVVQPIEGAIRVHYILFSGAAADVTAAGYGQILKNRKQVQPTLDGSWDTDNVCGDAANFVLDNGVGGYVNTFNGQCIPAATFDAPVLVALVNTSGAPITDLCVTIVYEYVRTGH